MQPISLCCVLAIYKVNLSQIFISHNCRYYFCVFVGGGFNGTSALLELSVSLIGSPALKPVISLNRNS